MAKEKVFIKFLTGETTEIEFYPDKGIEQVRQEIFTNKGFDTDSYRLIFAGRVLEDGRTLIDYNVKANLTIHCVEKLKQKIVEEEKDASGIKTTEGSVEQVLAKKTFFAKTFEGKKIEIDLDPNKTIGQVKQEIFYKESISIERQRLIFNGKQQDDSVTLSYLNVESGSIIHLVLRQHKLESSKNLAPSGARRINSKEPPSNRIVLGGAAGFIAGLCLTAGYCLYSAKSNSHLGTSLGSCLLETVSPKVGISNVSYG